MEKCIKHIRVIRMRMTKAVSKITKYQRSVEISLTQFQCVCGWWYECSLFKHMRKQQKIKLSYVRKDRFFTDDNKCMNSRTGALRANYIECSETSQL